ncbi:1,4-dihydroxy-2-naphthoate polyprenyltransferase [Spirochaetota bacterium]
MMSRFLNYIEIKTKITSVFAFLYSLALLFASHITINWRLTTSFFISMLVFDLTTTAINNYIDTKTNDQTLQFKRSIALVIIFVLFIIAAAFGLYLAYQTDGVVLAVGGVCFLFGVFYTYGPIPISRQPLGELFSGLFYGLLIPFLLLYINLPKGALVQYSVYSWTFTMSIRIIPVVKMLLFTIPPVCLTANIMLANNICDVEKDVAVKRYTLPYYLGSKSLLLFVALNYLPYLALIIMVAIRMLPPLCLISFATILIVKKNIKAFLDTQEKATTFINSIKNYVIIMGSFTLLIIISGFLAQTVNSL